MFDQVGLIVLDANGSDPDELALVAIDAGADDVSVEDGGIEIYTQAQDLHRVQEELVKGGYTVESAELTMRPKTQIVPESDVAVKVIRLVEKLEDLDDVQTVYTNLEITDDVLAAVT
jgi:transcriptional/translational regulatory protein YebC/TACO1